MEPLVVVVVVVVVGMEIGTVVGVVVGTVLGERAFAPAVAVVVAVGVQGWWDTVSAVVGAVSRVDASASKNTGTLKLTSCPPYLSSFGGGCCKIACCCSRGNAGGTGILAPGGLEDDC